MAATALLFDVDGTLWDSYPWYAALLEQHCGTPTELTISALRGGSPVVHLMRDAGISRRRFGAICGPSIGGLSLYPGVRDVLRSLSTRGVAMGIVTSLPGSYVEPMIEAAGLGPHFATIVHAGNCQARKPSPVPLRIALARLGTSNTDGVWYVGDQPSDAQAARRAGLRFAWAAYGYLASAPDDDAIELRDFAAVLQL